MGFHPDGGEFHDWLFLALSELGLGNKSSARAAAAKARAIQGRTTPDTVWTKSEVELLTGELDAALSAFEIAPSPREKK